jgi:hypothetical protein
MPKTLPQDPDKRAVLQAVVEDSRRGVAIHRAHERKLRKDIARRLADADKLERAGSPRLAAQQRQLAQNTRDGLPVAREHRRAAEKRLREIARQVSRVHPPDRSRARQQVCRSRQRSSHRVVTVAKLTSGDPDPAHSGRGVPVIVTVERCAAPDRRRQLVDLLVELVGGA